jgi:hypothetical protein
VKVSKSDTASVELGTSMPFITEPR